MKAIQIILISIGLLSFVQSQNPRPVPLPGLNLQKVQNSWYVTNVYESTVNNTLPNPITCYTVEISYSGNQISFVRQLFYDQNEVHSFMNFTVGSTNSVWEASDSLFDLDVLALDPVGYTWACLGSAYYQAALFLSTSSTLPNFVVNLCSNLLLAQGYSINSGNLLTLDNTCQSLEKK